MDRKKQRHSQYFHCPPWSVGSGHAAEENWSAAEFQGGEADGAEQRLQMPKAGEALGDKRS
jgi:hypothetical protein